MMEINAYKSLRRYIPSAASRWSGARTYLRWRNEVKYLISALTGSSGELTPTRCTGKLPRPSGTLARSAMTRTAEPLDSCCFI